MSMPLIYLASPYSHVDVAVREARFRRVCEHAAKMMQRGSFVFSPIAHTHPIAVTGELDTGFAYWSEYDRKMIAVCDELHVLMLDGWRESVGVSAEILIADELGNPVVYVQDEL